MQQLTITSCHTVAEFIEKAATFVEKIGARVTDKNEDNNHTGQADQSQHDGEDDNRGGWDIEYSGAAYQLWWDAQQQQIILSPRYASGSSCALLDIEEMLQL